jgi:hypothetical protein
MGTAAALELMIVRKSSNSVASNLDIASVALTLGLESSDSLKTDVQE